MNKLLEWLETRACTPAYAGWLLGGIALCFFGAATNTMAGWLYVLSGTIFALLIVGAVLPVRALRQLKICRLPIAPVSAGDNLTVELEIVNSTLKPKTLLQVKDLLPYVLSRPIKTAVEIIPPQSTHRWIYYTTTKQRGIYRWHEVELRTGTPLGLFWCRRSREVQAKAIVYPTVLPLSNCPLVDTLGKDDSTRFESDRITLAATEGITRTLRPYRIGDSTRLIHWRTSARLGEFQVRELEVITGGQEVIICLDSASNWRSSDFEQAVIAAASLYFYAIRSQLNVKLQTAATGLLHGNRVVLEALAATHYGEENREIDRPSLPLIWLTQDAGSIEQLPLGSRWVFFPPVATSGSLPTSRRNLAGLIINPEEDLQQQLQRSVIGNR
jgi:uncharacterized protein (DUF58 family)